MAAGAAQIVPVGAAETCLRTREETTAAASCWAWVLAFGVIVGMYLGWKLHAWWTAASPKCNKKTQSQVTYTWYNTTSRFTPLGEEENGAWCD